MNWDVFAQARWGDIYKFFMNGEPPLILQLLALNTLFVVLFIIRKSREKRRLQRNAAYAVQALLISANMFMMFGPDLKQTGDRMMQGVNHLKSLSQ